MPYQKYKLIIPSDMTPGRAVHLLVEMDKGDMAHRDVLAHFSHGQAYEHETSWLFSRVLRAGDIAIDVGANAGYFSILAATLVGPEGFVLGVEANPESAALIARNSDLNGLHNVRIENIAISDYAGEIVFGNNRLTDSNGGVNATKKPGDELAVSEYSWEYLAKVDTLSAVVQKHGLSTVRLLKIDTEGHELNVLRGATSLLAENKIDFIVSELNLPGLERFQASQSALRDFVLQYGYQTFLLDNDGNLPVLVPPGTDIVQSVTCNILFARIDTITSAWPTVRNSPASLRVVGQ
jgi:FkbM family methyltransferase